MRATLHTRRMLSYSQDARRVRVLGSTIIMGSLLTGRDSHRSFYTGLTRRALGEAYSCIPTRGCMACNPELVYALWPEVAAVPTRGT